MTPSPEVEADVTAAPLLEALGLVSGDCVGLVGAGGKTTTMLSIAEQAVTRGMTATVTTTTKIWPPERIPLATGTGAGLRSSLLERRATGAALVAAGAQVAAGGKLLGCPAEDICGLPGDLVLCEADGAAGRPLKVHGEHEPVVPPDVTHVLVIAGADAVGQTVQRAVHRVDRFVDLFQVDGNHELTPEDVARALLAATRFMPAGALGVVVLNKVDDEDRVALARQVRDDLTRIGWTGTFLAASRGRAVEV
jgi:probable selenium-dependent hydroxylase accessory protein YqeC